MTSVYMKKLLPHVLSIIAMILVSTLYFYPQLEGKVMQRSDKVQSHKMRGELLQFKDAGKITDTKSWNNSMFGGMPNGLLKTGREFNVLGFLDPVFQFFLKEPIGVFFSAMLVCYVALALLGVSPLLCLLGAVLFGLNTNSLIIWETGHSAKNYTITFFPLIVSGVLVSMRGRFKLGALVFAVGISLSIYHVHPQMLYYLLMGLGLMYIIFAIYRLATGSWGKEDWKAAGALIVALILGVLTNFSQVNALMSHGNQTMRGEPILKNASDAGSSSDVDGLNWEYAMRWSNGYKDLLAVIIPGAAGGSSGEEVEKSSSSGKLLAQLGQSPRKDGTYQVPLYHGGLSSTSGPIYLGIITMLLFLIAVFNLPRGIGLGLLGGFVLLCMISLGGNMPGINKFFFENLPYFDKFRAPTSVFHGIGSFLIIPAILGLHDSLRTPNLKKVLFPSLGFIGFVALYYLGGTSLIDFGHSMDSAYQKEVADIFIEDRIELFKKDSLRSLILLVLGSGLLFLFASEKVKVSRNVVGIGLIAISLFDLWGVGRRYLDSNDWVSKRKYDALFQPRPADQQIKKLEPKGRGYYRVHDLSINFINSAEASMHHNTIGGYSAAKLQRIQDLFDTYILKGDQQVLNMYNVKYIIGQKGNVQVNRGAQGNAWFIEKVISAKSADEEINKMGDVDLTKNAVMLTDEFKTAKTDFTGIGNIQMVDYKPGYLKYTAETEAQQLAVFSETWYPRFWKATINGVEVPILRANYSLRALEIPKGSSEIIFEFKPVASFWWVSLFTSLLLLAASGYYLWRYWQNREEEGLTNLSEA